MDLEQISREQTALDLKIANARTLELSAAINAASEELTALRGELAQKTASIATTSVSREVTVSRQEAMKIPLAQKVMRLIGRQQKMLFSLDEICGRPPGTLASGALGGTLMRSEFRNCTLRGWAIPEKSAEPFVSIDVVVSSRQTELVKSVSAEFRDDLSKHFGNPNFANSGFVVEIPMSSLPPESYHVELIGFMAAGYSVRSHVAEIVIR